MFWDNKRTQSLCFGTKATRNMKFRVIGRKIMRKKFLQGLFALSIFTFLFSSPASAQSSVNDHNIFAKYAIVLGRGVLNLATAPLEIVFVIPREHQIHPKAWPISFIPRAITNMGYRATSSVHDVFYYPLAIPFGKDITPLTAKFDLPVFVFISPER